LARGPMRPRPRAGMLRRIMQVEIEPMKPGDWPAVRAIHAQGIATGDATFDTEPPPDWEAWTAGHLEACRLVARDGGGEVVAWAALSPVQRKSAYRGVAEGSLYVREDARGSGVGRLLSEALIESAEDAGIWTLELWIFPENRASIALCESLGFRVVGLRERIGMRAGRWRDVIVMERRSVAQLGRATTTS
jgi:L-amino acid N-acyltransferase YncA